MNSQTCVIFGGAGFIGTHLARFVLARGLFSDVHIADVKPSPLSGEVGISTSITDVRKPISRELPASPAWIFNLAAIHREPGHLAREFFDTNLTGAQTVCAYAETVGCNNIFFTSSISVYGPVTKPIDELAPICPVTPYGASKYPAEWIHRSWQARHADRRLIVCRPAVVYGPGDPGNMLRMIRAIRRGYFAFPGSAEIYKSYGYIYGLLDSIEFVMSCPDRFICYNYAESPTAPLGSLIHHTKRFLQSSAPVLRVPVPVLLPAAYLAHAVFGARNPIHPTRVKKAGMQTHIVPGWLLKQGFQFKFPFPASLEHWRGITPEDFA